MFSIEARRTRVAPCSSAGALLQKPSSHLLALASQSVHFLFELSQESQLVLQPVAVGAVAGVWHITVCVMSSTVVCVCGGGGVRLYGGSRTAPQGSPACEAMKVQGSGLPSAGCSMSRFTALTH